MLLNSLQENLLTLLVSDPERAPVIRGLVDPALYGGPYRLVAARCYDYLDKFKQPPGDHLPDILSDKLEGNSSETALYADIVHSIHATAAGINAVYVMSQLETFIKRQSLRAVGIDLVKALQRDTEESLQEAEALLASASKVNLSVFDPGTRLSNKDKVLEFLDIASSSFPTGVPELDRRGFGPTRKEIWLFIGNAKAGKTWCLIQLAKMALLQRLKVCHITLEMSETRCAQRYLQAFFAMSKRKETLRLTEFKRDSLGRIDGFDDKRLMPALTLDDPNIRDKLEKRIDRWAKRGFDNIIIKQFPTGQLTLRGLEAYLDNLETSERFVPDLLIVDYPDLMKLDRDNFRLALDDTYKGIRGLCVARNIAGAIVSQSHRGAAKAKQVGIENVAEAYSKIAHADTVITYSSTENEHALGLARLHVAAGRNDADKFTVVISQQYGVGQFVIDSNVMKGTYWENIPHAAAAAEN